MDSLGREIVCVIKGMIVKFFPEKITSLGQERTLETGPRGSQEHVDLLTKCERIWLSQPGMGWLEKSI